MKKFICSWAEKASSSFAIKPLNMSFSSIVPSLKLLATIRYQSDQPISRLSSLDAFLHFIKSASHVKQIGEKPHRYEMSPEKRKFFKTTAPGPKRNHTNEDELFEQIGRLKMEVDWLKKTHLTQWRRFVTINCT